MELIVIYLSCYEMYFKHKQGIIIIIIIILNTLIFEGERI